MKTPIESMLRTDHNHIIKKPGYRGGMARVKGTGVTVAGIVIMHDSEDSIDSIVAAYPGLTEEAVREALDYHSSHKEEIDADIHTATHPPVGYHVDENGILTPE